MVRGHARLLLDHLLLEGPAVRDARVLLLVLLRVAFEVAPLLAVVLTHFALDLVLVVERLPLGLAALKDLAGVDHGGGAEVRRRASARGWSRRQHGVRTWRQSTSEWGETAAANAEAKPLAWPRWVVLLGSNPDPGREWPKPAAERPLLKAL